MQPPALTFEVWIGRSALPKKACPKSSAGHGCSGDTRMPLAAVFENLQDGMTIDEIIDLYDRLMREQVQAVIVFAVHGLALG